MKRLLAFLVAAAIALTLVAAGTAGRAGPQTSKPYAGKILQPRDVVELVAPLWPTQKVIATATALAESRGSIGAWHDNFADDGITLISRDCGVFQDNIPAEYVGTPVEARLRTESLDPAEYQPVAGNNVAYARSLYDQNWSRDGHPDKRAWQPWVAFTSGWATFPEWWTWHQEDGVPVGPWLATGRYVQQAIRGVANWHLLIERDMTPAEAIAEANRLAELLNVRPHSFAYSERKAVYWTSIPPKPATPPADGVGPRPTPNDGRL